MNKVFSYLSVASYMILLALHFGCANADKGTVGLVKRIKPAVVLIETYESEWQR